MKRILLLAAVALLSAPLCVQAQRSEITVSYGYAPTSNWSDSFSAIKDLVSDAKTDISGWGAVTVGYNLRLLGPLSIGAQVVCSTNEQKIKGTNTEIRNRYWAVMPNVKDVPQPEDRVALLPGGRRSRLLQGGIWRRERACDPLRLSGVARGSHCRRTSRGLCRSGRRCLGFAPRRSALQFLTTAAAGGFRLRRGRADRSGACRRLFPGSASGGRCAELSSRWMPGDSGEPPEIRSPLSELVPAGVKS